MRVVDVAPWGFLLEHEGIPFFVPTLPPANVRFKNKVQIAEDLVVVIQNGDLPFFFDRDREAHFFTKESDYGQLVMQTMIAYITGNL